MNPDAHELMHLARTSKRLVRLLLAMGENRVELLRVALQEEQQHILQTILLALGMAVFGLLAGIAFTAAVAVLWWDYSPVGVLLSLAAVYVIAGLLLSLKLRRLLRDWRILSTLLDQLREDRASLEHSLA
jgi:uncharacterized membrane protein YqjE